MAKLSLALALGLGSLALTLWVGLRSPAAADSSRRLMVLRQPTDPAPGSLDPLCIAMHCAVPATSCVVQGNCRNALKCSMDCGSVPVEKIAGCQYLCEMTYGYESTEYIDFIKCAVDNHCITPTPADGHCRASAKDTVQDITDFSQIEGDWWVTRGINCGNHEQGDKENGGGYDWYPCQHERFVQTKMPDGSMNWQNNITYCGGKNGGLKECTTKIIETVANVSLPSPGVVHHLYTDAPLAPQDEHWNIVSRPHPDWIFVIWCGRTPLLPYNGGIVLSRATRDDSAIPADVLADFKATAKRFNVEWDELCASSNKDCP